MSKTLWAINNQRLKVFVNILIVVTTGWSGREKNGQERNGKRIRLQREKGRVD
jgi:hypothetical protein